MDRRRFLVTAVAGGLLLPTLVGAQQVDRMYRVGYLGYSPRAGGGTFGVVRDGLRELGYVEGKNLVIEYRGPQGDPNEFSAPATELVAAGVDVIVVQYNPAATAAKTATTTIPIIVFGVLGPVETGLVKSLARPGGNVTGLTWEVGTEQAAKKLELFKQLVPKVSRMAVIWNPTVPGLDSYWNPFQTAASSLGVTVYRVDYSQAAELDRALATVSKDRPHSIFFAGDHLSFPRRQALCEFALRNRLPTLGPQRQFTEAGCLISYSADALSLARRAAVYVDKILKGAKPADLPMEQPTKYELVVNAKTAKALRLVIPQSLLLRADQVIE
jgi:putative ABC transport system substrate-binding protein